jgi:hypothetical protein
MKNLFLNSTLFAFILLLLSGFAAAQSTIVDPSKVIKASEPTKVSIENKSFKGDTASGPFGDVVADMRIPAEKLEVKPIEPIDEPTDEIVSEALKRRSMSSGKWVIPDGATEYGVEIGFAPQIATWMSGPKYYDIEDRQHLVGSLRWGKILGTKGIVTFSWAIEIEPINIAFGNEVDNPRYLAGSVGEPRRNREATFGLGINPASFRFIFFPKYRLRPQLGAGFGLVRHFKRVPTVEGTKFNFQVDFQIGGQYMLKENKALNFGYRYYHLSNMYLFNFNPGYNVNMFFVGYSIFK